MASGRNLAKTVPMASRISFRVVPCYEWDIAHPTRMRILRESAAADEPKDLSLSLMTTGSSLTDAALALGRSRVAHTLPASRLRNLLATFPQARFDLNSCNRGRSHFSTRNKIGLFLRGTEFQRPTSSHQLPGSNRPKSVSPHIPPRESQAPGSASGQASKKLAAPPKSWQTRTTSLRSSLGGRSGFPLSESRQTSYNWMFLLPRRRRQEKC
jgi:hypothetical protein